MAQTFQIRDAPVDEFAKIKVICIGAGLSGILSAIKLPQHIENLDLAIYEQSSGVGGTWLDNHYPGIACDIPAAAYQLSFENNPGWSQYYAPGGEILDYWKRVSEKYDVYRYMTFNAQVIEAKWNEDEGLWVLQIKDTKSGRVWSDSGHVLISATGILNKWDWPKIPGLHDFKGHITHTADWNHSYDMSGKRVALIGGGSSGIQLLPKIQPIVAHCDHYMRGKTWIAYREPGKEVQGMNPENLETFKHTKEDLDKWAKDPEAYLEFRCAVEDALNSGTDFIVNGTKLQKEARVLFEEKMRAKLAKKPEVCEALIPDFPPGCRRLTPGPGYLEAIAKDNVNFISKPIEKVTETGIQTEDGKLREVDAIICATGFDTSYKPRFPTYGLGGVSLSEVWDPIPEAYLSICPPKMPNYFMYLGPNGGPGTGSTIIMLEQVAEYICKAVAKLQREGLKSMVAKDEPIRQFGQYVDTYMKRVVYGSNCRSWFKRGQLDGRVVAVYPGGSMSAIQVLQNPRWEDFEWSRSATSDTSLNMWAWLGDGTTKNQRDGKSTSSYLREPITKWKQPVTVMNGAILEEQKPNASNEKPVTVMNGAILEEQKSNASNEKPEVTTLEHVEKPTHSTLTVANGRFQDKVVFITGGSGGLGSATGALFLKEGAKLFITDLEERNVLSTLGCSSSVEFYKLDVGDPIACEASVQSCISRFGRIDVLVHAAGRVGPIATVPTMSVCDFQSLINTNLCSLFYLGRCIIPVMVKQGSGAIVNIASTSGLAGDPGLCAYNASKAGMVNLTRAMALDHAHQGIRVNAVCPGFMRTPMTVAFEANPAMNTALLNSIPLGRGSQPEEIGKAVLWLASDEASFTTGTTLVVDGGWGASSGAPNFPKYLP